MNWLMRTFAIAAVAVLAGCSGLPYAGPTSKAISSQATEYIGNGNSRKGATEAPRFVLVDLTESTVNTLYSYRKQLPTGSFSNRRGAADIRIGVGDVVSLAIFEADSGGLFTPSGSTSSQGNFVRIPDQEVDHTGTIKVPFLGNLLVANRRPSEVQAQIEAALRDRAIEPQAVLTIVERRSARYTVVGAVNAPGVFVFSQAGERVLDAIGRAGGVRYEPQDTLVTLQSGGQETTVRLSALIDNPSNNIFLQPGDTISISRDQRLFTVFGATNVNGQVAIDKEDLTVADGLARVGGLLDNAADAKSIVIYRFMTRDALYALGASLAGFPETQHTIPVVLRLDLAAAGGYFLAQSTYIEPKDLVYVSNASLYDFTKVTAIVRDMAGTVVSVDSAVNAATTF